MHYQPKWGHLAKDYLKYNPTHRNACPEKEIDRHKPWPSSRSWEYVTRALAGADAVGASPHVQSQIITGLIGEKVGLSFINYITQLNLPKPEDILADPEAFTWPERYDMQLAIITGIVAYVKLHTTEDDKATLDAALRLCSLLSNHNQEMSAILKAGLRKADPLRVNASDLAAC
jgi:hypothetical protein